MSLALIELDTNYPPTWEGTEWSAITPVNANYTKLRPTEGQDPVNYQTYQKSQGDLFHRDLALQQNIQKLADYLEQTNGMVISCPTTMLAPSTELDIGALYKGDFNFYKVVAASASVRFGSSSADTGVRVRHTAYDGGGSLIGTREVAGEVTTTKGSVYRNQEPSHFSTNIVQTPIITIYNDSASFVGMSGWVALVPILDDDPEIDGLFVGVGTPITVSDPANLGEGPTNPTIEFTLAFSAPDQFTTPLDGDYWATELVDEINGHPIYTNGLQTYIAGEPASPEGLRVYDTAYAAIYDTTQLNYRFGNASGDVINPLTTSGFIYYESIPGNTPQLGTLTTA